VVVCNPIGDDYIRAHRALRHFAERLQRAGFAVLRFDFHGTGDSSGDERDPDRLPTWLGDIGRAIEELRRRHNVDEVCLAGLRLGATLAMVAAAERGDVDSVILWGPYLTGEAFVRESTGLHRMHRLLEPQSFALEPKEWYAGGEEALGFLLTPQTIDELAHVDLGAVAKPARHALVIGSKNVPSEEKLLAQLAGQGVETEYRHLPGHQFLITTPHHAQVPDEVLNTMVGWLSNHHLERSGSPSPPPLAEARPASLAEQPLFYGQDESLFGILHEPARRRPGERPAIVMLNAGTVHRIGPHRMSVTMARRWAGLGFPVLRVDLPGIGDSPAPIGRPENQCYPDGGVDAVQRAMSALQSKTGATRFLVLGLCSGGDLAFQVGLKDPRVTGAVIMNPRTFCVHDLELVETYKRARYYLDSFLDVHKLRRLFTGQVQLGRALEMLWTNIKGVARRRRVNAEVTSTVNDVPACLRLMAGRGVDTFLVVTEHDPGVEYVDRHFGRGMRELKGVKGFRRADFKGTDHTFTSLFAQNLVANTITEHFAERYS
jgi:pimeloyl-ACP methyl ester carboxylesterase